MTWMPDRDGAPRGRRHTSPQRSAAHRTDWSDDLGYDVVDRHQRTDQRQLGIPRILGRRARWVGARLRRET
ncbi:MULTISPECIES: hypothetical protein [unclassified Streptomyces]|uniref:hypothetical protein n=1 Tax=Streptomycetaceae TaxID=2062 RepID=UPI002E7A5863|nr:MULTISPECIES: hypothetical protein [unclassified Streptomyces]MED7947945.1 hypothetical protein [Streptomyces sp. BE303]MEE1823219.1 hypothetical protein [Streptomyces sp. BE20]